MPHAAPIEPTKNTLPASSSSAELSPERGDSKKYHRFADLRGVQWRIDLGILPSSSSTIDDLRRVSANSRRSYAALRRKLLISAISKDERNFRDCVMDNPLSQNPDSMWGQFFHKAELERMVDQDLSRLYPEHGSYFQAPECQGVLRRILLLWCIRHPNYGYMQGMHELLAPLLYVLQADLARLSEVRKLYQDFFTDNFDGLSFNVTDLSYNSDVENEDANVIQKGEVKVNDLNDLDPKIQTIISFCDAYGAEGELGIVLSEKFMEHDAYSMFDALMNGDDGAVAIATFYSHTPLTENGLPPVIEASSALYRLLSTVDFSLHTHLIELGVEPQYFALRWLRVLFGREFGLEDLLVIWDEIFALNNKKLTCSCSKKGTEATFRAFHSLRGAFISALAVSMIFYLRSSLLATENATCCLQRLLNFPEDVNLGKLIKKAKSLMGLAIDVINPILEPVLGNGPGKPVGHRHSLSSDQTAHTGRHGLVPKSYWEEQWRVMNEEEEDQKQVGLSKQVHSRIMGWAEKVKMRLLKVARYPTTQIEENEKLVSGNANYSSSDSNSNNNNNDHGIETERSSVASNSSVIENEPGPDPSLSRSLSNSSKLYRSTEDIFSPLLVSDTHEDLSIKEVRNKDVSRKPVTDSGDGTSSSSGMFPWLWVSGRVGPEDSLHKSEGSTSCVTECNNKNVVPEAVDHKNLKNLAQSMLQNIEVIESVENLSEKAMEALKELRKIRNILSEI